METGESGVVSALCAEWKDRAAGTTLQRPDKRCAGEDLIGCSWNSPLRCECMDSTDPRFYKRGYAEETIEG